VVNGGAFPPSPYLSVFEPVVRREAF